MNFKVLFIHPLETGLKSYVKVDDKIYFITFQTSSTIGAEFTVYSENRKDRFLQDSDIRKDLLDRFVSFLKEKREDIKVGIYFDSSDDEMYERLFSLSHLKKLPNGSVNIEFSIADDSFAISNLMPIKTREGIIFDTSKATFKHNNPLCFCENIKLNHNIESLEDCLVLIEHQDVILDWIKIVYEERYENKRATTKILQFPESQNNI
ncbi:hypothetical protein SFC65_24160 [Priestia filamentosa]|uniref:hypothetical protein n=1 Tax=Priestia filamentosa TaxID=1402861 RepID=UPI003981F1C5